MRIMFVGDINLGEYYTSFGHGPRSYLEHSDPFKEVRHIFKQADLVAGNLEAPLTTENFHPKEPERAVLRGCPSAAKTLYGAGFKVLQVANNHTVQHGKEGFNETLSALNRSGIEAIGKNEQHIVQFDIKGQTFGFFAASDVPDNTNKYQTSYQRLDKKFIEKVKSSVTSVDHLFVMLHWGLEASTETMAYQHELMEQLNQAGVRGVIGSHPHLFYEAWCSNNFIAAPSLGDFIFDLCWDIRLLQTGILDVEFDEEGIIKAQIWPIEIKENGCLPTPTGAPVPLSPKAKLYDLGRDMSGEQRRKLAYFFKNIHKGNLLLKTKFIVSKFLSPLTSRLSGPSNG